MRNPLFDVMLVMPGSEQAAKTPDNIAIVHEEGKITYRELNENI